ncbi:hypothetical protein F8M41_017513 [Gigaspora margarita]|uniref:Uncharacterized protein n=1 Tax=Gigaspora margarita TaxID=4874 RepID=A0A8H4EM57_GIGMA|nr:hypothetical protein F8M41_017513 [Gigaspora margarita]
MINLLFNLLIESGATLHKLDIYFSEFFEIWPEILCSLERNEQLFSRLQHLSLSLVPEFSIEIATKLLRILAKNATKIIAMKLDKFYSNYESQLFNALICIIESQKQLKHFSLLGEDFPKEYYGIVSALESQKKSLQEVIIEYFSCRPHCAMC